MRKISFRSTPGSGDVQPLQDPLRLYREQRIMRRAAWKSERDAVLTRIMTAIDADIAMRQRTGTPLGVTPTNSIHSGRPATDHTPRRPVAQTARIWLMRAASVLIVYTGGMWAIQLHYAELRAQEVVPVTATFTNTPLSVVMADLRRRYDIDIQACDPGYRQDNVTITLNHAPIDSVVHQIAQQTLRWAHWHGVRTVRLTPQPDPDRGWGYNVLLFLRGFSSSAGCRR
jgi:hypothetical protein